MIVITGATGNVGRPLTASLVSAGHEVTAVARGTSASLPGGPGIVPVAADLTDSAAVPSLAAAMAGAEALFLLVPGSGADMDAAALLETAATARVRRVVLLSSQTVGSRPGAAAYAPLAAIEAAVTRSGLEWTILRAGGLATNAFAWAPSVRARQTVFAPYGDVALPAIDPLDIAEVAAEALTRDGHLGQTYVLAGQETTTAAAAHADHRDGNRPAPRLHRGLPRGSARPDAPAHARTRRGRDARHPRPPDPRGGTGQPGRGKSSRAPGPLIRRLGPA